MGCRASKNLNPLPPIDSSFPSTQRPELDVFLIRASGILERIEILRNQIHVTKQKGAALAGTTALGSDYSYTKAVEVLFWSISAAKQGNINNANIVITEQFPPFIAMNTQDYCKETVDLFETLQQYLSILLETPESLQSIVQQLQKLKDEQIEIKRNINVKGNPAKAAKTIDENMKKLTDAINISAKVLSQVPDEQQNALELTRNIQKILNSADDMGSRAASAKLLKPLEIFKWASNEKKIRATSPEMPNVQVAAQGNNNDFSVQHHQVNQNVNSQPQPQSQQSAVGVVVSPNTINISNHAQVINVEDHKHDASEKYAALNRDSNDSNIHTYTSNQATIQVQSGHQNQAGTQEAKPEHQLTFNPNQTANAQASQLNQSSNIYATLQKANDTTEKVKNEGDSPERKKLIIEGFEEVALKESGKVLSKVKAPGYLSPGGSKQAGILQGEENIRDEDELMHAMAYDSTMVRSFTGKTQSYMGNKN